MHRILLIAALWLFAAIPVTAQQTVIDDQNAEVRTVTPFTAIKISSAIDLYLSQGSQEAVAVSAGDVKIRNSIKVTVDNGVLKIWYDNNGLNFSGNKKMKAYVAFRSLSHLEASGASDILVNGSITGEELTLSLSGASDFKGHVQLSTFNIHQSGASDVTVTGSAANVNVHASGASDCKGYGLLTETCTVLASGASDIKITVNKALTASATGASSVYYKGPAAVTEVKISSGSSITRKS